MKSKIVIYIKAGVAFFIPFGTVLGVGMDKFASATPNIYAIASVIVASLVAGSTGLGSFLSRSYADSMDQQTAATGQPPENPVGTGSTPSQIKP